MRMGTGTCVIQYAILYDWKAQSNASLSSKCCSTCIWAKLNIGSYVVCGRDCVIEAFAVGSCVHIGDGVVIGRGCVIKDCCLIEAGSILAPGMVVPPFAIVSGAPAQIVGELPESAYEEYRRLAERTCRRRNFFRVAGP